MQMDAFSLFQSVAAQAFSDEFAEEQNGTLRQQVLDMLFNRVQLQPLQTYVCTSIVSAVERLQFYTSFLILIFNV
jgi:hypothetical protein